MQKRAFSLCPPCAARLSSKAARKLASKASRDSECHICRGLLSKMPQLLSEALSRAGQFEWGSFSVSSSFPRHVFVREEEMATFLPPGEFSSLKNSVNAQLIADISHSSGKPSSQRSADAIFQFDFANAKADAKPTPIYIFGHYLKLSRQVCQSRWHCSECRGKGCAECKGSGVNYPSVEGELAKILLPAFGAQSCALHASGREDVDVRALGSGRPFVLELKNPRKRSADMQAIEDSFASNEKVRAAGLALVGPHFIDAVCGSHFDKEYSALVSAERLLSQKDADALSSLSRALIFQQTPKRVMSRRADLLRKRRVHSVSAECAEGGKLRLRIFAEAGTYIKELISSDGGRTKPSVSEILGCKAVCEELDVSGIRDYFLETVSRLLQI